MNNYSSSKIKLTVCDREWILKRPSNLEVLWDNMILEDFGEDERLPYWVELWPASLALCDWIYKSRDLLHNKFCLDLGCGLGLSALIGSWVGAKVIGMDYEEEALKFAAKNAEINKVPQPFWVVMDWRSPAVRQRSMDFIWGGDIMYERNFVDPILAFINHALSDKGRVWIAEPNRDVYQYFRKALFAGGWEAKKIYSGKLAAIYEQPERVTVNLWELNRG